LANWITVSRFPVLLSYVLILFLAPAEWRLAAVLLLFVGLMLDTVDGVVARRRKETSLIGSVLDIAADRKLSPPGAFPALAVVGPPGDFTPAERLLFREAGFLPALVNDAILKTETAALAVAAILKND
jgi:phosphatidylglycerophosphate synthase